VEHTPIRRLELLREIAETINGAYEMEPMLDIVLKKLLELTGLETGWIFLMKPEARRYRFAADANLPPALLVQDRKPMRSGTCWCVEKFRDGRLKEAVNILNCKRIEDSIRLRRGDTAGITHHASIPLRSGEELFGILNVASPGKVRFTDEELELLQGIAYQIGTALHRIRLFGKERKRADLFTRLGEVSRRFGAMQPAEDSIEEMIRLSGERMGWPGLALYIDEASVLKRGALYAGEGAVGEDEGTPEVVPEEAIRGVLDHHRPMMWGDMSQSGRRSGGKWRSGAATPILLKSRIWGVLAAGSPEYDAFDEIDAGALEALAAHIALTLETMWLNEKSRELTRWEERNRIARDLHDSVSQMLFSLSLNARGLTQALPDASEGTREALEQIQRLSQSAIGEMRSMIRQLRPAGIEEGLLTGLQRYGEQIGLSVSYRCGEFQELPERLQNVFWRIGQEALNNVSKHSGTFAASIELSNNEWEACMTISDDGPGMDAGEPASPLKYGMLTMKERAESVGGTVTIKSKPDQGTKVIVRLPI